MLAESAEHVNSARMVELFEDGVVLLDVEAPDLAAALRIGVDAAVREGRIPSSVTETAISTALESHAESSCVLGHGTAVPHAHFDDIPHALVVFIRLTEPLDLPTPDGERVRFVFLLLGPSRRENDAHLDTLMRIARAMSDAHFCESALAATGADVLREAYRTAWEPKPQAPPSDEEDPLAPSGTLGGGLRRDMGRFAARWWSDWKDGLRPKSVASTLFLYFACMAPAVAFGGLMEQLTHNDIGAVEMLVATAVCGVVYALFAGQPLTILGGTGPLLAFTAVLYELCQHMGLPFLPVYAWIGLWTALFCVIIAVTEASRLVSYFTRFTDETFSALISFIFIVEAVKNLAKEFAGQKTDDVALLSLLLAMGTFYVARQCAALRRSHYLRHWTREALADFGPTIAMVLMVGVAISERHILVRRLGVPAGLTTTSGRPWLVSLFDVAPWVPWAAILPALLGTILVFMDQNITTRIVNSPSHALKKGVGYHLDMLVMAVLIAVCSLFGLPWVVAATVRSLNHVRSLATYAPGGDGRIVSVVESRVSALAIHGLVALSLLALPLLGFMPMAVLYGLFLYMGVSSLTGNQFFERVRLWLVDPGQYPATHYVRRVPARTLHLFTAFQAACLAMLWAVKASALGILFPVAIALLVPLRRLADRFFGAKHMAVLDLDEEPDEEAAAEMG